MKKILISLSFVCQAAFAQQVAITIDDFPFREMGLPKEEVPAMISKLYDHLDRYGIKATGFLNSNRIDDETSSTLQDFLNRGHEFGNHTHRHSNVDQVGAQRFIADIDSGKMMGKEFINSTYFRYPYLRRGNTLERRDSVYTYLAQNGYKIAHVSIDNNEWIYNRDFVRAKLKMRPRDVDSIKNAYLDHMKEVSISYENKAQKLTGRSVKHILLIHANPINAECLGDLLKWYTEQGWGFISLEEALKDPIYSIKEDFVSPYGWSHIDRLVKMRK
ncbi:polysaccharide deacetylase family protein [Ekhidna sp.]|uniref:polysaccharide deacetylase family protein n=1 Tax=Ekhidna sp. TaxID=2608089 RepID=UPI0035132C14